MSFDALSPRQREVAALLALGLPTRAVAQRLDANIKTIDTHRKEVLRRLGVQNTAQLVRKAILEGFVSMHDEAP